MHSKLPELLWVTAFPTMIIGAYIGGSVAIIMVVGSVCMALAAIILLVRNG